ncbi:MAG: hypothetical protein E7391_05895 [Ruminococcaceae bacterium]|nr:hypothetical protein [Oscillospiraceae bacterium]
MENKRKNNGEGSIFQVSDNKWIAKISLGTRKDGKPNIKQFSGKTEAVVKNKLKEFKKSSDYKLKHMPSNDTVKSYFTMWLKEFQYNKLKPLSYDRLESTVNNHIIPNLGNIKIDKVTREQIQVLINELHHKGLSYSSIKKVYVALNSCYKHAMIDDVVLKNPCLGIVLPSQTETTKQITAFTDNEVEQIKLELVRTKANGDMYYTFGYAFLLILNTGLRMGEALSLLYANSIKVIVDKEKLFLDVYPIIKNDRTLVPMRAIFEKLGATVDWDDKTKTVIATKDGVEIKLTIDKDTAMINGLETKLDTPATIENSRTMVPVRFISEALGKTVEWDGENRYVIVK